MKGGFDERSAGGIVFKREGQKVLWLLIKTLGRKNRRAVYKFPKGHTGKNEFLKQTAVREVEEEGRVKAEVISKVGSRDYIISDETRGNIVKKVTFFLMEYVGESSLRHFDRETVVERVWLSYEEVAKRLAYDSERGLLRKAREKLGKIGD